MANVEIDREIRVRVVKEEMVRPRSRILRRGSNGSRDGESREVEPMFLSAVDTMGPKAPHFGRILFYKASPTPLGLGGHHEGMEEIMKRSLGLALEEFYPLAGRLHADANGRLHVVCDDTGVPFIEAVVEGNVTLVDLSRSGRFSWQPFFTQLAPAVDPKDYCSAPPLIVQVSRFKCGGIALGVSRSHILCDGHSFWHFMVSWAECARGEPISLPPIHNRSLLKIDNPSLEKAILHLDHIEDEDNHVGQGGSIKMNTFLFTKDMVETLKKQVGGEHTAYEIICAHIWQHTTKAREHLDDKKVGFVSVVNMRERIDPPLGKAYFGNAVMFTIAVAKAGELKDEDLVVTAQRIHRSIRSCNSDTFHSWLHWLEIYGGDAIFERIVRNGARIGTSSSHNFPIFKLNFGWGKPLACRIPSMNDVGTIVFFPSGDILGDIEVLLPLPTHVMRRLESDDMFVHP